MSTCARIVQMHHAGTVTQRHAHVQRGSPSMILRVWICPSITKHLQWATRLPRQRNGIAEPWAGILHMRNAANTVSRRGALSRTEHMHTRTLTICLWSDWAAKCSAVMPLLSAAEGSVSPRASIFSTCTDTCV